MTEKAPNGRTWSDEQLTSAVAACASWRSVMRHLGLRATCAGAVRIVKRHANRLALDTSHFRGNRTWSDAQLRHAVIEAQSWDEVLTALGLETGNGEGRTRVKAHAIRLGLNLRHLEHSVTDSAGSASIKPDLAHLRDAGTSLAAAWFVLCGCNVALPVEPAIYDLLVAATDGIKRVQVKTTTFNSKDGWLAQVGRRPYSAGNKARLLPYDPEVIDWFFVVDGDLTMYLIPSRVIAGRVQILLRPYTKYIVGNASGLMSPRSRAA
ncbi:MAG: hypothetical protein JOY82_26875 [Streptosporangiaceae bacterium]|nr:hypothetical protein [Streptosporangiaceae bacterium]